ncbi:MAG: hypothetical protein QMD92_01085 [bacterium]|nr:hypothetical protein [bacterium]
MLKRIILTIILSLGFFSCISKEEIEELEEVTSHVTPKVEKLLPQLKAEIKEIKPVFYTYQSYGKRDPFVPLIQKIYTAETPLKKDGEERISLDLKNIHLIGIIRDKENSMALLCDHKENGYILKQGSIYDDIGNKLKEIKGIVKEDYVILEQNKKSHTITLSSYVKEEEKSSENKNIRIK